MKTAFLVSLLTTFFLCNSNVFAELTKNDINEIRKIVKEESQRLDKRIDEVKVEVRDVRAEIRDVRREAKEFMLWGFGVVFAGIFSLIVFVLWDRRSALAPAIRRNEELAEREKKIERALKEYAVMEPRFAEALRHVGLL